MDGRNWKLDKEDGRDVPTDPNLLTAPSVLSPDSLAVADLSSRETSNGSSATEGGDGGGACGDCPACKAIDYIDSHGDVVTEVVDLGEGVYLGPDDSSFDPTTHRVVMDWNAGIGVIAIDETNPEAVAWWAEQKNNALARELIKSLFGEDIG